MTRREEGRHVNHNRDADGGYFLNEWAETLNIQTKEVAMGGGSFPPLDPLILGSILIVVLLTYRYHSMYYNINWLDHNNLLVEPGVLPS